MSDQMGNNDEKAEMASSSQHPDSGNSSISSKHDDPPPTFQPGRRFYLAFLALAVLTLMVALDGTSLSVALPVVAQALRGSALEAFWSGTSFLLASTVFQPSFAQLSHVFGRVQMVMVAIALFFAGVMMAAVAKDFTLLLAGRTVQGIGGGGKWRTNHNLRGRLTLYRYHRTYRDHGHRSCSPALSRSMVRITCTSAGDCYSPFLGQALSAVVGRSEVFRVQSSAELSLKYHGDGSSG